MKYRTEKEGDMLRIYAVKSFGDVQKGEKGGLIEKEANLSHDGNAWVADEAWVSGNARVTGNAWVADEAWVSDDARVGGNAWVIGHAWVSGKALVSGGTIS